MEPFPDQLHQAGINIDSLEKGDFFSKEQVDLAIVILDPKIEERIQRFERGEIQADPSTWAAQRVIEHITSKRAAKGREVVCRSEDGGIRVLTDSQASPYLNKQAIAGLQKHSKKSRLMSSAVDMAGLTEHEQRTHASRTRRQQFICAAHENASRTAREMQAAGVEIQSQPLLEADDA